MLVQTQFQNVLNTNYAASFSETGQIRELLVQPTQELIRLNSEIQHLKSTLSYLFSQREKLQGFVNSHKALISPIRRLPAEVLSEIFVHCLQTEGGRNPTRSPTEAPLLLTLVCRRWRQVALSTAGLWRSIHIYFPSITKRHEKRFKEIAERRSEGVKAWLARSGSLPLSISLVVGLNRDRSVVEDLLRPLLDVVFSFSHRWGELMLRVPSPVLKVIEETVKPEELLQMRTLTVDYDMATRQLLVLGPVANHSEHQDVPLAGLICNAPALRELRVHEPVQNVYRLDLDWSKLTHFRAETGLGVQKPEDVLRVLARGAPSLQSVIVSASFRPPYTTNSNPDRDIITLPSLHTLSFALQFDVSVAAMHLQQGLNLAVPGADGGQEVGAQIQDLFDSICTPNLKHLTVRFGNVVDLHETHVAPQIPFVQLLLRSACRLESLDIGFVMTKESLIECLASVPTLKSLTIEECLWTVMRDRQRMAFLNHQNPATAAITLEAIAEHAILTDEFLQRFSPISEGGNEDPPTIPLCPELETLTLQKCESLSEMALVKFVQARAPPEPAQEGSAESGPTPPLPSSSTKPLRYLNAAFQREKGMITDVDMAARKEMKELKKAANVVISYPKNSIPPDLPHSGQHPPGAAFRSSAWRNLLWEQ